MYLINGGGLYRDGKPLADDDILEAGVRYAFGGGIITCKDFSVQCLYVTDAIGFHFSPQTKEGRFRLVIAAYNYPLHCYNVLYLLYNHAELTACAVWSGVTQIAEWFQRGPADDTSPRAAEATGQSSGGTAAEEGGDHNSDEAWVNVGGNEDPDEAWVKVVGGARRPGMEGAAMSRRYSGFDTSSQPQEGKIEPSETTALLGVSKRSYSESGRRAND
jgi:hypothetical protein